MPNKAQRTTQFIIKTVSPLFNKKGYTATSLSDITQATGLTKGSIYGNFKNKEAVALAAYKYNSQLLINELNTHISKFKNPKDQLFAFTEFYSNYDKFTSKIGGCPILNVGIDSSESFPELIKAVRTSIDEIQGIIISILEDGEEQNVFHIPLKNSQFAKQLFTMIMGAVSMATITKDVKYLKNTIAYLDLLIKREIKIA